MAADDNFYEILGIKPTATQAEIDAAYRRLVKQLHPDVGGSAAIFRIVHAAYKTLRDPASRKSYDERRPPAHRQSPQTQDATAPPGSTSTPPRAKPEGRSGRKPVGHAKQAGPRSRRSWLLVSVIAVLVAFVGGSQLFKHRTPSTAVAESAASSSAAQTEPATPTIRSDPPTEVPVTTDTESDVPTEAPPVPDPPIVTTPPAPTCRDFRVVVVTYVMASERASEIVETDYWPRVTVINGSKLPITATFAGEGSA